MKADTKIKITLVKFAVAAVLVGMFTSSSAATGNDSEGSDWYPVGFGIGIPDLHEKPDFRNDYLLWPGPEADIYGLDLTALCGFHRNVRGVQIGGIIGSADTLKGFGFGCVNYVFNDFNGLLIGGYAAIARRQAAGCLLAGGFSYVNEFDGLQIAGAVNWAENGNTVQLGGINYAGSGCCIQIGGVNYAGDAKCLQIGLINCGSVGFVCCPIVRAHW